MTNEFDEEAPLDPVMERVRKKMVRLLIVSIGIMVIGLMAVLFAIVYKISNPEPDAYQSAAPERLPSNGIATGTIEVDLPSGATVVSREMIGDQVFIEASLPGGVTHYIIVDLRSGKTSTVIVRSD